MAEKLELVKALAVENKDVAILKDLAGASADCIHIEVLCSSKVLSVTRVTHNNSSFLIKQFKSADVSRVLQVEYNALKIRSEQVAGCVPQPYLLSEKHNCVVLENFKYNSLRSLLTSGELDEGGMNRLIEIISSLHKKSFSTEKLQQLETLFKSNTDTEDLLRSHYVDRFVEGGVVGVGGAMGERLKSEGVRERVRELYKSIGEKRETLTHGHLNDYNVEMLNGNVKLIGNHLAMLGPTSLDIGNLLAQYLTYYHVHMLTEQDNDAHRQVAYKMIYASTSLVDTYLNNMADVYTTEEQKKAFVSSVAGHCGVELVNWASDSGMTHHASEAVLDSGLRLIETSHRIHTGSMLTNIALMLTF